MESRSRDDDCEMLVPVWMSVGEPVGERVWMRVDARVCVLWVTEKVSVRVCVLVRVRC